jgi:hypothetical protein
MPLSHSVRGCVGMHERLRVCSRVHVRVHVHPFARARAAWVCVCLGVCVAGSFLTLLMSLARLRSPVYARLGSFVCACL